MKTELMDVDSKSARSSPTSPSYRLGGSPLKAVKKEDSTYTTHSAQSPHSYVGADHNSIFTFFGSHWFRDNDPSGNQDTSRDEWPDLGDYQSGQASRQTDRPGSALSRTQTSSAAHEKSCYGSPSSHPISANVPSSPSFNLSQSSLVGSKSQPGSQGFKVWCNNGATSSTFNYW